MGDRHQRTDKPGPFRPDQVDEDDRYEISEGHPVWIAPTGGDGSRATVAGGAVLDTDPDAESTGIDTGFALNDLTLRAPDVAVGSVPDRPGWVRGAPLLAVEYASVGQDEADLQTKIRQFLMNGTRFVWVVRLLGPRRVEVYVESGAPQVFRPGESIAAPGVLRNAVPVEALYDRDAAHEATLRNLLQRHGYESLEAVAASGREEGREEAREQERARMRETIREVLAARAVPLDEASGRALSACNDSDVLRSWLVRAATAATANEVVAA